MATYALQIQFQPFEVSGYVYLVDSGGAFFVDAGGNYLLVAA